MTDVLPPQETARIRQAIENFRGELEAELGKFVLEDLPSGRVLLKCDEEVPHVAYMSDPHVYARLIVDDYVPEIGKETQ